MTKWLSGLFAGVTTEQGSYMTEKLLGYKKNIAEAAIKTHRAAHDFLDIPQLLTGLRAAKDRDEALHAKHADEKVVDWLRRTLPATFGGMTNYAVLSRHFSDCMAAVVATDESEKTKGEILRMMSAHAAHAFVEIGHDLAAARELAGSCVR